MDTIKNTEKEYDVMRSAFGIARALKRGPHRAPHMLPPGVERTLMVIAANDGLSSGDLCEILDVRPSSLSEITDKMVQRGLLEKKESAEDKRVTKIFLTELGKAQAEQIETSRTEAINALTSCFTEDEAKQFCELADKLAEHLKSLSEGEGEDGPEGFRKGPGHCGPHGHHGPHGGHGGFGGPGMHCRAWHFAPKPFGPAPFGPCHHGPRFR